MHTQAIDIYCLHLSASSEDEGDEYFIWEKYLERQHAKPVPKTAFKHVSKLEWNVMALQGFTKAPKDSVLDNTLHMYILYTLQCSYQNQGHLDKLDN